MEDNRADWTAKEWCEWFDAGPFDLEYEYQGRDLGANYEKEQTTWKLWAPTAQSVRLNLYTTGSDQEEGASKIRQEDLLPGEKGVWSLCLMGDFAGVYYTFEVEVAGTVRETVDPYAKAAGINGRRAMVADLPATDPPGWEQDPPVRLAQPTDAVIWEVHVKDFSWHPDSGMKYKGKYLAFTETDTHVEGHPELKTGLAYLKELGVTHVHLLPVFDYLTVDEADEKSEQYNWGYDPLNYNVPEGSYSTDPYHGEVRVRELKQLVQALHMAGIGVIFDLVYNHTFQSEDSPFQKTVPYYYYRIWPDGEMSNGSGCGNETATERPMVRRYILDSIRYWAEEYHADGFRFDLMGLYDVETMNAIRAELDTLPGGREILIYGEPWAAEPPQMRRGAVPADKAHVRMLNERIAIFNDETRDCIKGSVFDMRSTGFINGAWYQEHAVRNSLRGWAGPFSTVKLPMQTVSYVSAHDNFTLWDKLIYAQQLAPQGFDSPNLFCLAANKMAAAIVLLAQGIPFMQAGEEFGRTKKGDGNSYCSSSALNQLDWGRTALFGELLDYYKGLIQLRKAFAPFRCSGGDSIRRMVFSRTPSQVVAFTLSGEEESQWKMAAVILNASNQTAMAELTSWADQPLPNRWDVKADAQRAGLQTLWQVEGNCIFVQPRSVLVLVASDET